MRAHWPPQRRRRHGVLILSPVVKETRFGFLVLHGVGARDHGKLDQENLCQSSCRSGRCAAGGSGASQRCYGCQSFWVASVAALLSQGCRQVVVRRLMRQSSPAAATTMLNLPRPPLKTMCPRSLSSLRLWLVFLPAGLAACILVVVGVGEF